ncbi:MAG: hypothetical protein GC168_16595 [Candidatus Hydrogenedens sp.]|nr:hypothetical protein [Candidatus Hydrogenedens sp.]
MAQRSTEREPRRRGCLTALALSGAALCCAVFLGHAWLTSASGAEWAAARVSNATGLKTTIGSLSVAWYPVRIEARDIQARDAGLVVAVSRAQAYASLRQLIAGTLRLDDIAVEGAQVSLTGELEEARHAVARVFEVGPGGGAGLPLRIALGSITMHDALVAIGERAWATVSVDAQALLSPEGRMQVTAVFAPGTDTGGDLKADLRLARAEGNWTLDGSAAFSGNPASVLPRASAAAERVQVDATLQGTLPDSLHAVLKGGFAREDLADGTVQGEVWWQDGLLSVNDLVVGAPELSLRADGTLYPGKSLAYRIYEAEAGPGALDIFAAQFAFDAFQLAFEPDASVKATEVHGAYPLDDGPQVWDSGTITFQGISVLPGAGAAWPPMQALSGTATLAAGHIDLAALQGSGLDLSGRLTPGADGAFTAEAAGGVDLARIRWPESGPLAAVKKASGSARLESVRIARAPGDDAPIAIAANATLQDAALAVAVPGLDEPVQSGAMTGKVAYADGAVTLDGLRGDGLALDGTVALPGDTRDATFDLKGNVSLAHPLVALAVSGQPATRLKGWVTIERASGSLPPGGGAPQNLVLAGSIRDGGFVLDAGMPVSVSGLQGTFATDAGKVKADLAASTDSLGSLTWSGTYDTAAGTLEGRAGLDATQMQAAPGGEMVSAVLAAYGASKLDLQAMLPAAGRDGKITFNRQGAPPLSGSITLVDQGGKRVPGEIQVLTELPLGALPLTAYPEASAAGTAAIRFNKAAGAAAYQADVNLDAVDLRYGAYVRKAAGQAASVSITGSAEDWQPRSAEIQVLGERVPLAWEGGGLAARDLSLNLAALAPLFTTEVTPRGTISGSFQAQPLAVNLQLNDVSAALSPDLRVDRADGGVQYDGATWRFDQLRVQTLGSDFTLDAGLRDGRWQGSLRGARLDVNRALDARAAYAVLAAGDASSSAPAAPGSGLQGELAVSLDAVRYRNGELGDVNTTVRFAPEMIDFTEFRARLGAGLASGSIRYRPATPDAPAEAAVNLTLQQADARVIDGLGFPEPRGIAGLVDAVIDMRLPLADGVPPQNGMSGTLRFTASNGTYGQLGFATKILSVLRTTEVLRLSLPTLLRDEGLVFDTSNGAFQAENGYVEVQGFDITSKSYALNGNGWLDFPRDNSSVQMGLYVFESVTGIVDRIPVVGEVVDRLKERATLNFLATGSPYAPNVQVLNDRPAERIDRGVRDAIKDIKNLGNRLGL